MVYPLLLPDLMYKYIIVASIEAIDLWSDKILLMNIRCVRLY